MTWATLVLSVMTMLRQVRRPEGATAHVPVAKRASRVCSLPFMCIVIARCTVDYVGRLTAHLPLAPRLLLLKADG